MTDDLVTSASTNNTVLSNSVAMLMAKLIAVNDFPSRGNALVTMIKLPLATGELPS